MKAGPDSRLLENLLKAEKTAQESFKQWTKDASAASVALSAWAVADSGETPDLMETSMRIGTLLGTCAESQRTYLDALTSYRASLKDVLMRESDIRTILRDREILVSRLIALSKKKPSESGRDVHAARLEEAKRELGACEATLKAEEFGLMGVKRRVLRDAFGMRMRSLGELGCVLEDSAKAAIELLDQLGVDPRPEGQPAFDDFRANIASYATSHENASDLASPDGSIAPSHSASQVARRTAGYANSQSDIASEEYEVQVPPPHFLNSTSGLDAAVPTATAVSKRASFNQNPTNSVRSGAKAARPPETDSSDDEPTHLVAHQGGGASLGRNKSTASKKSARIAPSEDGSDSTARGRPAPKRQSSDRSDRNSGFFTAFASLFRNRKRSGSMDSDDRRRRGGSSNAGWNTRTSTNLKEARRTKGPASASGGVRQRRPAREDSSDDERTDPKSLVRVVNSGGPPLWRDVGISMPAPKRERRASLSIAGEIYNPPLVPPRQRAMSDIGVSTPRAGIMRKPKAEGAASPAGASSLSRSGTVTSTTTVGTTGTKKKKKRVVTSPPLPTTSEATTQPGQKVIGAADSRYSTSTWVTKPAAGAQPPQSIMSLVAPASPALADQSTSRKYGENGTTATAGSTTKLKKKRAASSVTAAPSSSAAFPSTAPAHAPSPMPASPPTLDTLVLPSAPARVSAADYIGPQPPVLALPSAPPRVVPNDAETISSAITNGGPPALTNGLAPPLPGTADGGAGLGRRKSVRIADEGRSNLSPAASTPSRAASPAPILRSPSPQPGATAPAAPEGTPSKKAAASAWTTRAGQVEDDSSDEDDQGAQSMSAYHKARRAMNKSAQAIEEASGGRPMSDVAKGKQRAV